MAPRTNTIPPRRGFCGNFDQFSENVFSTQGPSNPQSKVICRRFRQLLEINAHEMAPRTRRWLQERGRDTPHKGPSVVITAEPVKLSGSRESHYLFQSHRGSHLQGPISNAKRAGKKTLRRAQQHLHFLHLHFLDPCWNTKVCSWPAMRSCVDTPILERVQLSLQKDMAGAIGGACRRERVDSHRAGGNEGGV